MGPGCRICGRQELNRMGTPRINEKFPRIHDNRYEIYQCANCEFYFVLPEIDLTQEEWRNLYEDGYFPSGPEVTGWKKDLRTRERKARLGIIVSRMSIKRDKFLDMGCGEGYVLQEARACGFDPYGVDIADNVSASYPDFKFFRSSVFEAGFPDDYFSVIYMDSVLEHVLTPMEMLRELWRILKPGGVLFVIVPNEDSLMNRFTHLCRLLTFTSAKYGKIKPFVNPFHVNGFNANSLKTALSVCGFSDIDIRGFGGDYENWKGHRFGTIQYFWHLASYPIELLSILLKNQVQLMALSVK